MCTSVFLQDAENLKLKDFQPVSIYKVPQTRVEKAKFPVIDFHSQDYPKTNAEVDTGVKRMDQLNIIKTLILSYSTGARFDSLPPDREAFAGSIATADRLVRTMVTMADLPLIEAVRMTTKTPAVIMGVADKKGALVAGKDAEIVIFDYQI